MTDTLVFSGTANATYTPPAGWTNRGDIFRIGPDGASICGLGSGSYSQLVSDTTASGLYESIVIFDRIAAGSGDSIASLFQDSSRNGFACELGGGTLYCNKQVGGGNAGLIIAAITGLGEPLGINTIRIVWDLVTSDFEVFYNGASVATGSYNDYTANMGAGGAIYRDGLPINITIKQLQSGVVAATTIDTLTTSGSPGLVVGQPFAMTTTGLGTITSITATTAATPAATTSAINLSLPSGDGTGEMKYWVDAQYYPFDGTVSVTASDGTLSATGNFALSLPSDQADVVFNAVETTDNTYLGNALLAAGHPLANGDIGYYPPANGLIISPNSGVSSAIGATTFVLWVHKVSGIIERYDVVINDAGEITDVTGITSRGITSRGITSRHISKRGLS